MSCKPILSGLAGLALVVSSFSGVALAQYNEEGDNAPTQRAVMPYVLPPGGGPDASSRPRLGFMGTMIHGYGMRIDRVTWGLPAQQAGLESGDVIWSIEGRRILTRHDFEDALMHAALYHGGQVHMTVKNIRFDMGLSPQQFVSVTARAIGGPVAYSAPGSMPSSGSAWAYSTEGSEVVVDEHGHVQNAVPRGAFPQSGGAAGSVQDEIVDGTIPAAGNNESGDY